MNKSIEATLDEMTLTEKAALTAGLNMWMTKGIERLNIPPIHMYDGTNGIRKTNSDEEMGITTENVPATCYPTGSAIGSSWNTELLGEIGIALGRESKEMGVELLLGPGVNMKRTPLGEETLNTIRRTLSSQVSLVQPSLMDSKVRGRCFPQAFCRQQSGVREDGDKLGD